jgi:hypothetical protein
MPMERARYPADWSTIALAIKTAAHWRCEECDRPCRRPGEDVEDFAARLLTDEPYPWHDELYEYVADEESGEWAYVPLHPQRYTLTTAHLDQQPSNNDRSNLKALCPKCHLAHDRPHRQSNRMAKQERNGQMTLGDF